MPGDPTPGYLIEAEPSLIDTERFEAAYREARSRSIQNPAGAALLLDEALALWRGPAYAEFADGFARSAATRLEELRLAAYEDRAALALRPAPSSRRSPGRVSSPKPNPYGSGPSSC